MRLRGVGQGLAGEGSGRGASRSDGPFAMTHRLGRHAMPGPDTQTAGALAPAVCCPSGMSRGYSAAFSVPVAPCGTTRDPRPSSSQMISGDFTRRAARRSAQSWAARLPRPKESRASRRAIHEA